MVDQVGFQGPVIATTYRILVWADSSFYKIVSDLFRNSESLQKRSQWSISI